MFQNLVKCPKCPNIAIEILIFLERHDVFKMLFKMSIFKVLLFLGFSLIMAYNEAVIIDIWEFLTFDSLEILFLSNFFYHKIVLNCPKIVKFCAVKELGGLSASVFQCYCVERKEIEKNPAVLAKLNSC